jgi:transcriptional regulator of heat shock response
LGVVLVERSLLGNPRSDVDQLREEIKATFQGIREEFDDHLESINDNTNEIQANYEYLCRLDAKLEKLSERLEQVQQWISRFTGIPVEEEQFKDIKLTEKEKEVFLVLYTASNEKPITYAYIAKALRESEFLVRSYITNLIEKGVPILKQYIQNTTYLSLDNRFREQQAKRNLLHISQQTFDKLM